MLRVPFTTQRFILESETYVEWTGSAHKTPNICNLKKNTLEIKIECIN